MNLPTLEQVRETFVEASLPVKEVWDAHHTFTPSWQSRFRTGRSNALSYEVIRTLVLLLSEKGFTFDQ